VTQINARAIASWQIEPRGGPSMEQQSFRDYHRARATRELDLAYRADSRAAMEAHLRLSALHMRRLAERTPASVPAV
jgi:hypothetical protein